MPVYGKKEYKFYLTEENMKVLQKHFDGNKKCGGVSDFMDKYIARSAKIVKMNPKAFDTIEPGRMTFKKFWQLAKMDIA